MKKLVLLGIASYIVVCAVIGYGFGAVFDSGMVTVNKNVNVKFSNTLWETVGDTMDAYNDKRDIREVIHNTIEINHMSQSDWQGLNNNDVIVVPVEYEKEWRTVKYDVTSYVALKVILRATKDVGNAEQAEEYAQIEIMEDLEDRLNIGK